MDRISISSPVDVASLRPQGAAHHFPVPGDSASPLPTVTDAFTPGAAPTQALGYVASTPSASTAPASAPSAAPPVLDDPTLARLLLGAGPSTAMDHFFGRDADRVASIEHQAPSDRHPAGCLKVVTDYPPHIAKQRNERELPNDAPAGWSSAWGQSYRPPFGTWTRQDGAWESACFISQKDPKSPLEDSLLSMRVADDGSKQLVLWERIQGGGGIFYRLDADAWLKDTAQPPPVLEAFPYRSTDPARAPFFTPPQAAQEPPAWSQFFGPNAPHVAITRFVPNEYVKTGGAQVDLSYEWGSMRSMHQPLGKEHAVGYVQASFNMEDFPWLNWTRTADGWKGETRARVLPDNYAQFGKIAIQTELDDEGGVRGMVLRSESREGDVTEHVLDAVDFLAGKAPEPRVIDVRHSKIDVPRKQPPSVPGAPGAEGDPPGPGGISDQGDWIVIDGIKLQKKK